MMLLNGKNFWLDEQANKIPGNPALISHSTKISYREFYDRCISAAKYFVNLGINENDHVGIFYDHNIDFFIVVNALWLIGAVPVPLSTRSNVEDISSLLEVADIKHLLIHEKLYNQFSQTSIRNISVLRDEFYKTTSSIETSPQKYFSKDDPAVILFTSGSGGKPKAVLHTFNSLYESVKATDTFAELSEKDIWLASLPLYHIGGFMINIRALLSGAAVAYPETLKYDSIKTSLKLFNPTHISFVSTTLKNLLDDNFVFNKGIINIFLGGGPLDKNLCMQAINKGIPIVKVYGSTETCSMVTALHPSDFKRKPDSVGLPMNKSKIKIMNKNEDGVGEIVIKSPALFKKYYNDPLSTSDKLKEGEYFTGDFGRLDDEGYLYIESRREDIIITGGENVSVIEVENALKKIDGIKDAYSFAIENENWGQTVNAVVSLKENSNLTEDKIKEKLRTHFTSFKIPKRIFFIDTIPRTELGKVNKQELLKLFKINEA